MITVVKFGYRININDSNPDTRVEYLSDCDNASYTPAHMDFNSGKFDYGSWGDAWFIKGCKPCMVQSDGENVWVDYYLNPNDYSQREDGSASDEYANTNYPGNVMVEIPLVWVKCYEEGNYFYCYISDQQLDDTYKAYAHINPDGDILDKIYLSAYEISVASMISTSRIVVTNNRFASFSGRNISVFKGVPKFSTWIVMINSAFSNNVSPLSKYTSYQVLSDRLLINNLLILTGKSTNVAGKFGAGKKVSGSASNPSVASTTGTMDSKGLFWGTTDGKTGVKVFGIENYYGNGGKMILGCAYLASFLSPAVGWRIKLTYGMEDGSQIEGYYDCTGNNETNSPSVPEEIGKYLAIDSLESNPTGQISVKGYNGKNISVIDYGYFPSFIYNGSESTYDCSYCVLPKPKPSGLNYSYSYNMQAGLSEFNSGTIYPNYLSYSFPFESTSIATAHLSLKPPKK